jgi:hypothetical protein
MSLARQQGDCDRPHIHGTGVISLDHRCDLLPQRAHTLIADDLGDVIVEQGAAGARDPFFRIHFQAVGDILARYVETAQVSGQGHHSKAADGAPFAELLVEYAAARAGDPERRLGRN